MALGIGPRQCTGRNVAAMEIMLITVMVVTRYEFELYDQVLRISESFLDKASRFEVGIRRRMVIDRELEHYGQHRNRRFMTR
jgi:hypothetical protein